MTFEATRRSYNGTKALALIDVLDRPTLRALQDVFSERYGVAAALLDRDAEPIAFEHGHCDYCKEIRKSTAAYHHCRACDGNIVNEVIKSGQPARARCDHGGLLDFAAPIRVDGEIVAFFFIGQIREEITVEGVGCLTKTLQVLFDITRRAKEEPAFSNAVLRRKFNRIPILCAEEIERLQLAAIEFANDMSSALTKLVKWRKPAPVEGFVVKMGPAVDFDELMDLCIREIPELMGTRDCSVLTVVRGSHAAESRLVLQRTSFAPSRHEEGKATYALGEGLTGWVWKNKRPLRLRNIRDPLEASRYHGLKWAHKTDDSKSHKEWLGVPLFGRREDVIGVIRVPQKKRAGAAGKDGVGAGFNFDDEILLMAIGQHVARRIEELQVEKRVGTATRSCLQCAMELTRATDEKQVGSVLMRACERAFGTEGRAHFFNLLGDGGGTLRIASIAGDRSLIPLLGLEVPLDSSLSGMVIRDGSPAIIHDVDKAKQQKQFFPANEKLECGMSAPIQFAQQTFGALSVCADRPYEFSEEPDLRTLEDLATLAGSALARLDAHWQAEVPFAHFTRRAGHALHSRIATLEITIAALKPTDARRKKEIASLEDAVEFLKTAADQALRYGRAWDQPEFQRVYVGAIVSRLKRLYLDSRLRWIVRPTPELRADPWLVEQIIVELVVNALRFAPSKRRSGRIVVKTYSGWTPPQLGGRRRAAVIEVRDNGPGVPQNHKQLIFQPYRTVDESRLGLGLSIVMRAVQAHGGLVFERGREGHGAFFRVVLPTAK